MLSATREFVRFRQAKRGVVSGVRRPCGGARGPVARSAATTLLALPHVRPRLWLPRLPTPGQATRRQDRWARRTTYPIPEIAPVYASIRSLALPEGSYTTP